MHDGVGEGSESPVDARSLDVGERPGEIGAACFSEVAFIVVAADTAVGTGGMNDTGALEAGFHEDAVDEEARCAVSVDDGDVHPVGEKAWGAPDKLGVEVVISVFNDGNAIGADSDTGAGVEVGIAPGTAMVGEEGARILLAEDEGAFGGEVGREFRFGEERDRKVVGDAGGREGSGAVGRTVEVVAEEHDIGIGKRRTVKDRDFERARRGGVGSSDGGAQYERICLSRFEVNFEALEDLDMSLGGVNIEAFGRVVREEEIIGEVGGSASESGGEDVGADGGAFADGAVIEEIAGLVRFEGGERRIINKAGDFRRREVTVPDAVAPDAAVEGAIGVIAEPVGGGTGIGNGTDEAGVDVMAVNVEARKIRLAVDNSDMGPAVEDGGVDKRGRQIAGGVFVDGDAVFADGDADAGVQGRVTPRATVVRCDGVTKAGLGAFNAVGFLRVKVNEAGGIDPEVNGKFVANGRIEAGGDGAASKVFADADREWRGQGVDGRRLRDDEIFGVAFDPGRPE